MNALNCEVLVVGGGAAGVAAAAAAGRAGAQVVLLEHYGFLGGLATAGAVGTVCGLYLRDAASAKPTLVASGFPQEFSERLTSASDSAPKRLEQGLWVLPFQPWAFERVADGVLAESGSVTLVLHATAADVSVEGRRISQVRALAWNDLLTIKPQWIVDCSGEATVVSLAGETTGEGGAEQSPALVFAMDNVAPGLEEQGMIEVLRVLRRGVEQGQLPAGCERISMVPGREDDGRVAFKVALLPIGPGEPGWRHVTAAEREGRRKVEAIRRFLVANATAFKNARFAGAAPQVGVRAGRRIQGRATLQDEDVLGCRKFADGIARGCWPMEQWRGQPKPVLTCFEERGWYEIPLDCLRPTGLDNVLIAGRCLSATAGASASARVIGTALATGWAAGSAAVCCADGSPLEDAVNTVRRQMAG
jgi:hypothetical protein